MSPPSLHKKYFARTVIFIIQEKYYKNIKKTRRRNAALKRKCLMTVCRRCAFLCVLFCNQEEAVHTTFQEIAIKLDEMPSRYMIIYFLPV